MTWTTAPQPEIQSRSSAASKACETVSKSSSGPISGLKNVSQVPNRLSAQVPATAKSSERLIQPMRSRQLMYGLLFLSRPAMTGSQKYGAKRLPYRVVDTKLANVSGLIWRFSRIVYSSSLNRNSCSSVVMSVIKPVNPRKSLSCIEKMRVVSMATVVCSHRSRVWFF